MAGSIVKGKLNVQAVLINPGWELPDATGSDAAAKLAKVPIPRLCPVGFIFVWVPKRLISAVVKQLSRWGFVYIENLTWVFQHANNEILRLPSEYVQCSHLTLYIFRKDGRALTSTASLKHLSCLLLHKVKDKGIARQPVKALQKRKAVAVSTSLLYLVMGLTTLHDSS